MFYSDCGDVDAWKRDGFCTKHGKILENPLDSIAPDIRLVGAVLLRAIAKDIASFCEDRRQSYDFKSINDQQEDNEVYNLCLHNDDINTNEHVISSLIAAGISHAEAIRIHNTASSQGFCFLPFHSSSDMPLSMLKTFAEILELAGLNLSMVSTLMIKREKRVRTALSWLATLAQTNDGMCRMVNVCLAKKILLRILKVFPYLPKAVAMRFHDLFLSLMADQYFKMSLAIAYAESYAAISKAYGQGHGTSEFSIFSISVQFLNREIFVSEIVLNHSLFTAICYSIENMLIDAFNYFDIVINSRSGIGLNTKKNFLEHSVLSHRRYNPMVEDLKVKTFV